MARIKPPVLVTSQTFIKQFIARNTVSQQTDLDLLFALIQGLLSHCHGLVICKLVQGRVSLDSNTIVMVLRVPSEIGNKYSIMLCSWSTFALYRKLVF